MLGNLTLSAIPFDSPIIMWVVGISVLLGLLIIGLITRYRRWGYLWREWFTSVDHKRIGVMYILLALVMLVRGFADAIMMRAQQVLAEGNSAGYLPPHHFDQIFSAHGTIMILFMAMPFLVGLWNIVIPQQLGARDLAYPFLNSVSFWLTAVGAMLVMLSLAVGDFSTAGWTGYPPYSELAYSPDSGVDYWLWSIQISGLGTLLTGINFLVTIVKMRAPGITYMRMPVFVWTALVTCVLIILSFPVLTVTLALLSLDRYLDMHFFTNALGGNMMMYLNLFWIWGHPEVYILILPAFGVYSEVVPTFSQKPLFGYRTMVYATAAIGLLSFTVWLHHFFTMGSNADVNAFFGISTMIIAVPTGVKLFNWLFTMFHGRVEFTPPILFTIGFFSAFTIGGMTGVLHAVPPADYMLHNSLFLVAHFHNMLIPGALFAYLAGYMYWFPKAFGFKLNEKWGKRSFWAWLIGFYLAFMPLYVLGFMGMPRRMEHYMDPAWLPWLVVAAIGAVVILFAIVFLAIQLTVSIRERKQNLDLSGDPWNGRTLEWATASPPAVYNFAHIPEVHSLDAFWEMKQQGLDKAPSKPYEDIHMPRNSALGPAIGAFAFVFGFAMIWHIWWLAGLSALAMLGSVILRSFDDDIEYVIPAAEVERTEQQRRRLREQAESASTLEPDSQTVLQV